MLDHIARDPINSTEGFLKKIDVLQKWTTLVSPFIYLWGFPSIEIEFHTFSTFLQRRQRSSSTLVGTQIPSTENFVFEPKALDFVKSVDCGVAKKKNCLCFYKNAR